MKKIYMLLISAIIVSSCKKNEKSFDDTNDLVLEAKQFYAFFTKRSSRLMSNDQLPSQNLDISGIETVYWEDAASFKEGSNLIVEVPVKTKNDEASTINGSQFTEQSNITTRLIFIKRLGRDDFEIRIAKVHLFETQDRKLKDKQKSLLKNKDFNGLVLFYTTTGIYIEGVKVSGKKLSKLKKKSGFDNHRLASSGARIMYAPIEEDCSESYVVTSYIRWCAYRGNEVIGCGQWMPYTYGSVTVCTSGGGGGGGGSSEPTYISEENNVLAFNTSINTDSLGDCAKQILKALSELSGNTVADNLQKFSGNASAGFNWVVQNHAISDPEGTGVTGVYNATTKSITTGIDLSKFSQASDLAMVRTLLHESQHAYLLTYFQLERVAAPDEYRDLLDAYNQESSIWDEGTAKNNAHHTTMIKRFADQMADLMVAYGNAKGLTLNKQYCKSLMLGGMQGCIGWDNLPQAEREEAVRVTRIEQYGVDLNGVPTPKQGTNLSCN